MFSRFATRNEQDAPVKNGAMPAPEAVAPELRPTEQDEQLSRWLDLKTRLHERLLEELNLAAIEKVAKADLRREVAAIVNELLTTEGTALNAKEFGQLIEELLDEVLGLGPLEPLLKDPTITDILVNTHRQVFVERHGVLETTAVRFQGERHLLRIIDRIVSAVGRRVDESQPWVDARLPDGSRVNAIIPPCALDGPLLSIRKFAREPLTIERLIANGALTQEMATLLNGIVKARLNLLISGGTGSGKTTLLNAVSSYIDARLPDGSRVNAIIPPLALDGPILSIRRFGANVGIPQLLENGTLTEEIITLLASCVHARLNVLISGGTGAGKTTLLNVLSSFIPSDERIITIEDAAELQLMQEHVVRLETRPPNAEGRGEVVARDLVKNALRMRPDRILIGEVRSAEALDMLQAMNTGHEGSLTTIHANSPRDALSRMETMILMAGTNLPDRAMREQMASALDVVVQIARMADGTRRITSITEVTGMEGEVISTQEIWRYRRRGIGGDGRVLGNFEATGIRPGFTERLRVAGVELPPLMFEKV